jgi:kelch-like protein 17 (actinfilin)
MAEKLQHEVTLRDVDAAALQQLVDYSYTGEILITEDNVQVRRLCSPTRHPHLFERKCCKTCV